MNTKDVNGFSATKKEKKRKRGRPKLTTGEHRSVRRMINLRSSEAIFLDSLAKEAGRSFNSWAREILLAAVGAENSPSGKS